MVYLTKDTQNRQSFLPNIWLKLVGHISDWGICSPYRHWEHPFGRHAAIWLFHLKVLVSEIKVLSPK